MPDYPLRVVRKRIDPGPVIIVRGHPSHCAEAAYEIYIRNIHAVEKEIIEVDPVTRVSVAREIKLPRLAGLALRDLRHPADQCNARCIERVSLGVRLRYKEARMRGALGGLSMHGHGADKEIG